MKRGIPSFTVIVVFILLTLCGLPLIHFLNIELNPTPKLSSFSVSFSWPGAEPKVIEQEVTSKLEALFAQISGVTDIRSISGNEMGSISLSLDKEANQDAVRFEVSTLIRQVWPDMPAGMTFPLVNSNLPEQENQRPLLTYNLNSPEAPPLVLQYAEDYIRPLLSQIPGINKTDIYGASPLEWIIEYDPEKLKSSGITTNEIQQVVATGLKKENLGVGLLLVDNASEDVSFNIKASYKRRQNNISGSSSDILTVKNIPKDNVESTYRATIPVALQTNYSSGADILKIPIKKLGDRIICLDDVATLKHVEGQPLNYYRINSLNTINILLYAVPGENNLVVGKKTKEVIEQLTSTLPKGYELLLSDDSTEYINHELHNIALRSLCTLLILLIFILLVTRNIKHVLLILIMLVGNLCIAIIFYYLFRLEIHLYALAGITVSLGLMTDNVIIMSYHLRMHGNRKAFIAILAGTFATISALVVVFFLKEEIKINIVDFALVIIINQSVSLLTALFVIPALMDKLKLDKFHLQSGTKAINILSSVSHKAATKHKREFIISFTNIYRKIFLTIRKRKSIAVIVFILGFGLPLYMMPEKWDGNRWYNRTYNSTIGNEWYKSNLKPLVDKITGGALRLFTERVYDGSYFRNPEETSLFITATLPRGSTLLQANAIASGMETYLKQFYEIKLFQSNITTRNVSLNVYFKKEYLLTAFPNILKGKVIAKAIDLGGADWAVYGFGLGFSNQLYESAGNYSVRLLGYNYDRLLSMAEIFRDSLAKNPRISQVNILSERTWYKPDNIEFVAQVNKEHAIIANIALGDVYKSLQSWSLNQPIFAGLVTNRGLENIRLRPQKFIEPDVYYLSRQPLNRDSMMYKFNAFSTIGKETTSPVISKENQQYQIYLQFDFTGPDKLARKYVDDKVDKFKSFVPIGYSVSSDNYRNFWWAQQDKKQYWLLILIVVTIFFICAVLFESLLQPFAVILTIPVGYIGIFLTFYLFKLNFDQGGFAALVILSGITVNAAIYILNDFNHLCRQYVGRNISDLKLYFKAFNYKIIPIILTVVSTALGFVPFLIGEKQPFWFALAAGSIGGLLFSLLGIVLYLPLFLGIIEMKTKE